MNNATSPSDQTQPYKYWAFISYNKNDAKWARWLHRAIETYGIPAQLVSHPTPAGHPPPKRFQPLFRDRDELSASADLGTQVEEALQASRYLIVICSPHAARSKWVNKEIETFQNSGLQDRVLAMIVEGEPNASDQCECFPPALRLHEPTAADARERGDGKTNAKLKLLAGMLGVTFDALKQRDAHRRIRRLQLAVTTSLLLLLGLATLTAYAFHQRNKAVKARQQAESILEFLVYDMRDALEPIGRLDIVNKIQKRVDEYHRDLGIEQLLPTTLHNKSAALVNAGNLAFAQGDLPNALKAYRDSHSIFQRLTEAESGNAGWQRDLMVSCWRMAVMAERSGANDALDWWRKAYQTLSAMKQRGIMLPTDEPFLEQLKQKISQSPE